jgi:hypothetical protein
MRRALAGAVLVMMAGCGGGDGAEPDGAEPEPQARERTSAEPAQARPAARSDRDCLKLWNSDVQPGTAGQKSPSDFVVDIAAKHPVDALARYWKGNCIVVVPFKPGATAGWVFVAPEGRTPWGHPSQIRLRRGRIFAANARSNRDGTLE